MVTISPKKILLISTHTEAFHTEPHSILTIAAYLEEQGHTVMIYDGIRNSEEYNEILLFAPDMIGISFMTFTKHHAEEIIKNLRAMSYDGLIVLGGIHVSVFPEQSLKDFTADIVVLNEGEETMRELCALEKFDPGSLATVKGIGFLDDEAYIQTDKRPLIQNLDMLPIPARHLIDMDQYLIPPGFIRGLFYKRIATVMTSRGCPFKCSFCAIEYIFEGKFRQRSVAHVMREVTILKEQYNVQGLHFFDENMIVDKQWFYDFCDQIEKLNIVWSFDTHACLLDDDLLKRAKEAGCVQVDLGVESGSDAVLQTLNKGVTVEQCSQAVQRIMRHDIRTFVNIIIGAPGETESDLLETIQLLEKIKPDFGVVNFLTPIPGTALYDEFIKNKGHMQDIAYTKSYNYEVLCNLSSVDSVTLQKYHKKIRMFFLLSNVRSLIARRKGVDLLCVLFYLLQNSIVVMRVIGRGLFISRTPVYKIVFDVFYELQQMSYNAAKKVS